MVYLISLPSDSLKDLSVLPAIVGSCVTTIMVVFSDFESLCSKLNIILPFSESRLSLRSLANKILDSFSND